MRYKSHAIKQMLCSATDFCYKKKLYNKPGTDEQFFLDKFSHGNFYVFVCMGKIGLDKKSLKIFPYTRPNKDFHVKTRQVKNAVLYQA